MDKNISYKLKRIAEYIQENGVKDALVHSVNRLAKLYWDYKRVWTPRRLYVSLKSIEIDRPIFVLGTQGTGLTLITRMMRRNPRVVMVGGGPTFWMGNDEMDKHYVRHETMPDDWMLRTPGHNNLKGDEEEHPEFGLERNWLYATDELLPEYRSTKEDYAPQLENVLRRRIQDSIRAYARDVHEARFLDMSQTYSLKVPLLRECLDDPRFVLVVRNPYVMCWREITKNTESKYQFWNERPSQERALRLSAEHWRNTYRIALEDLQNRDDAIVVHFEDLIDRPKSHLEEILDHTGLEFYPDIMIPQSHHKAPLGGKSPQKWYPIRKNIDDKYLEDIERWSVGIIEDEVEKIAKEFGYSSPDV
jgi:hypothetical protein